MRREVNLETMAKYHKALNELVGMCKNGYVLTSDLNTIKGRYSISTNLLTAMLRCGYVSRVAHGKYKVVLAKYDPIHAKNVVEKCNDIQHDHLNRKRNGNQIRLSKKSKELKHPEYPKFVPQIKEEKPVQPPVKIHKKEGTIEVPKDKFLSAEVKTRKPRSKKGKRTFSILWGLIKFNY